MPSVTQAGASNTFGLRPSSSSWTLTRDFLVIGRGVAGLSATRRAFELGLDVLVIDSVEWRVGARKQPRFADAATNPAQDGLAVAGLDDDPSGHAANGFDDTIDSHIVDTFDVGAGHYDEGVVASIIRVGAAATGWLTGLGATFDPAPDNPAVYSCTKEGEHHARRIIYTGGDATDAEIERALEASVTGARALQNVTARQLIAGKDGRAPGAPVVDPRGGSAICASAILLATGGVGYIYRAATAPPGARGEAIGMTFGAGVEIRDMEFIQLHPTVFYDERSASDGTGRRHLISEAVRGEGAILVDSRGNGVIAGANPRGDLAPRDIASRAIAARTYELGEDYVFLDTRHIDNFAARFSTITAGLTVVEINPTKDLILVAPAVYYTCGGIAVDPFGVTSVSGLFAAGKCSVTGLCGANRLASNSLLEGLAVGKRVAEKVAETHAVPVGDEEFPAAVEGLPQSRPELEPRQLSQLQTTMREGVDVTRNEQSLWQALVVIDRLSQSVQVVATRKVVEAALARPYTLGCYTWFEKDGDQPAMTLEEDTLHGVLSESITRGLIWTALQENMSFGPDVTSLSTVSASAQTRVRLVARQEDVIAAIDTVEWVLQKVIPGEFTAEKHVEDGTLVHPSTALATISAPTRGLLIAERITLNILTHASGVATTTRQWVGVIIGTGARVCDSRKTLPGLRNLEKYVATCDGGTNYHYVLGDEVLIKDNHVVVVGPVSGVSKRVWAQCPELSCEAEVGTLVQLDEILSTKPDIVMLGNFEIWETQIAVQRRSQISPATQLELSGGLTIDVAREFAFCGVDYLVMGALAHLAKVLDVGLDFDEQQSNQVLWYRLAASSTGDG